jgi:hypothetical protein
MTRARSGRLLAPIIRVVQDVTAFHLATLLRQLQEGGPATPTIYDQLLLKILNVKLNEFDNVRAIACAVSDSNGTIELFAGLADNRGETTVVAQRGFPSPADVVFSKVDQESLTL